MFKIKTLHKLREEGNEKGSALIFALVLVVLVMAVVSTMVAISLIGIQKTIDLTKYSYNEISAQSAISNALAVANNETAGAGSSALAKYLGESKAVYGVLNSSDSDQGIKWRWYTQRINNSSATAQYYVIATGYRGNNPAQDPMARTLRATVSSLASVSGSYNINPSTGQSNVIYNSTGNGLAQWGIFGTESVNLNDGAQIKSYTSDTGTNPATSTGQAQIASGGNVFLNGPKVSLNKVNLLSYSSTKPNRCSGAGCSIPYLNNINYSVSNKVGRTVEEQCPNPAITYPAWVASENSGKIESGCYNTLLFDTNTIVSSYYNGTTNPADVYVKGNITVNPSVKVNDNGDPKALRIYSQGGDTALFKKGTAASPTKFYGIVSSATLRCTDESTNGTVTGALPNPNLMIYGSLVCSNVTLGAATTVWWDELAGEVQDSKNKINRVWWVASIEEI